MTKRIKLAVIGMFVAVSIGAGSLAAAIPMAPRSAATEACFGTVNPDTHKCEEPACGLGDTCCACVEIE